MSMLDLLLNDKDLDPVSPREGTFEVKRLSKKYGKPFLLKLKPLKRGDLYFMFQNRTDEQGQLDYEPLFIEILESSCVDPDWKDKRLVKKLGCQSLLWVTEKTLPRVLTPKELGEAAIKVCELSGLTLGPQDEDDAQTIINLIVKNAQKGD